MPSNAISGVGIELRRYNTGTNKWERLAEILSYDGPNKKRDTIDVTNMDSAGGYKEFIGGFRESGDLKCSMNFTRDTYDLMNDDFESETKQTYELAIPDDDNTTMSFLGLVTDLGFKADTSKQITADVTLKVSGQITINSGSGPAPS
jgi:predicted secreted protein